VPPYTKRLLSLPEYPLAKIPEQKRQLIARGVDVIDLGAGDADLSPPPAVVERISEAVRIPTMSRYGFALGLVEYREAVARFMKRRFGQDFDPLKEIIPLIGSKEGLSHLALAYLEPGDTSIVPEPGGCSEKGEDPVPQLPQQSDLGDRSEGVSRGRRETLQGTRHPAGV